MDEAVALHQDGAERLTVHPLHLARIVSSFEVVAMTGYRFSGSMKLSSWPLPSSLSPVMRTMNLAVLLASSGMTRATSFASADRIRSAWSMFSQNTIALPRHLPYAATSSLQCSTLTVAHGKLNGFRGMARPTFEWKERFCAGTPTTR
ncbi:MAG: hypothetical protein IV100_25980 [Myxococcales bacterium]|nr:hypothetical protein [Myxococcales bacterium]